MNDYIDLLQLLSLHGGSLKGVRVYGYISHKLSRPSNLMDSCALEEGGIFVRMNVMCVDLSYYAQWLKENGLYNKGCKYFVNGSICLFVQGEGKKYPDWYSTLVTLRQSAKQDLSYVCGFQFHKRGSNWFLACCQLDNILSDEEFEIGRIRDVLENRLTVPPEVLSLPCMHHAMTHFTLKNEESTSSNSVMRESLGDVQRKDTPKRHVRSKVFPTRLATVEKSVKYDKYFNIMESADNNLKKSLLQVSDSYSICDPSIVRGIIHNIQRSYTRKPVSNAKTGRMIIQGYLKTFGSAYNAKYSGQPCGDFLVSFFDQIVEYVDGNDSLMFGGDALSLCEKAFGDNELLFAGLLGQITGVHLDGCLGVLSRNNMSLTSIVTTNPYLLYALGLVSFNDSETLALIYCDMAKYNRFRNMCLLHKYIMENGNDTCFVEKKLYTGVVEHVITKRRLEEGLGLRLESNVKHYLDKTIRRYSPDLYKRDGWNYRYKLGSRSIEIALKDYIDWGLGCTVESYVTSTIMLKRELYIYNRLYEMSLNQYDVEDVIDKYEAQVGFKLEPEQKQAYELLKHGSGVLTGGAGSGKTTTVEYLVMCLEASGSGKIQYGAPTGKAAKVMQGVVKHQVKTLHSLCRLGIEDDTLLTEDDAESSQERVCYVFDEMSMVTIDLLYKVLRRVGDCRIYFVGDIKQLNAIGKGMVLKNLLRFLPCVNLLGSKRSTGGIVYNSRQLDEGGAFKDTDDFIRYPSPDDMISKTCVEIVKHFLGVKKSGLKGLPDITVDKDNIQVITPFVSEKYNWGAKVLNSLLQPLFNQGNMKYWTGDLTFIVGDRVIHTKKNNGNMQWYSSWKDGNLQKVHGNGIANGEVGKFVGVLDSRDCLFLDEIDGLDDYEYPENLRDDSSYSGVFMVVEYYDVMTEQNFYILYRGKTFDDPEHGRKIYGDDIYLLDLFYAGSVHKMQGSQAEVCICCLGSVGYRGFLTRNMVYTMITRGQKLDILLGSVSDSPNSQLMISREDIADEGVLTIGEILCQ